MARSFLPVDRDQRFLLPPDMREWLPEDHLVWFMIEMVDQLDLSCLEASYRLGAQGRRPYDVAMLLTLLLYAYSQGIRSSRKIEAHCRSDVAFKVICGTVGETPDHSTICRFRRRHQDAIEDLFCQVLVALHSLGMLPLGVVAIDGTKLEANAALGANRSVVAIREEVRQILVEAEASDAAEDARYGERRGDELPEDLVDPRSRAARLLAALDYAGSCLDETDSDSGESGSEESDEGSVVNVTDPDSQMMCSTDGYLQGYNAQVAIGAGQVVLACEVTNRANDYGLFSIMLANVAANLEQAGVAERPEFALGDAGYFDTHDLAPLIEDPAGPEVLVSTAKRVDQPKQIQQLDPAEAHAAELALIEDERAAEQQRRAEIYQRVHEGELDMTQARTHLGLSLPSAYAGYAAWRRGGTDAVPVRRRAARTKRPAKSLLVRRHLEAKLADPINKKRYKARAHLAEGFFAAHKHQRNGRWLQRRGLRSANSEFTFDAIVHNVLKMRAAITAATGFMASGLTSAAG